MLNIQGYEIREAIYISDKTIVYRGVKKKQEQQSILKFLNQEYPTLKELTRYKQEYEITRSLKIDKVINTYGLLRYQNSLVIILEDFGGQSLKVLQSKSRWNLENFLTIAIKITESLAAIHDANIIHKDINPSNIVYNPQTEQLKIIDFGISTRLSQEFLTVLPPEQLEGTLAYIAPEQTGRMNRGIDYRSDFYSLGVTLYELLTNQLPFATTDPMELVHCHMAQQAVSVHELISNIPVAISNIIDKLLAKTPEDRYQSALGIKADLETCLSQLQSQGQILSFPLGSQDIMEKFHIPQKLYGREQEVDRLLTAFEEVSQGKTGMILISGYSGIGKTALVNEIHKPITKQRGRFISGKFDQLQRDIPYSAIAQAFRDLIRKLLSESQVKLQAWKEKILSALGNNGQIIIDVIPELEKIIGKQPEVEQLGRTESQNRFNLFFKRFLKIFCHQEYPLVIFIDDLQWADLSSLNLIEQLISDPENQYFLLIGAYRDNEVSSTHPLIHTVEKINQAKVTVGQITLAPLKIQHINQLVADTLNCSTEVAQPLSNLIAQKTGGNPFFLTQLLYSLYQENLLVFNTKCSISLENNQQADWQWDLEEIENVSITDNVVDLMVSKIAKLEEQTQKVLKLAACIGNKFNLAILSIVNDKSQTDTAQDLQSALDEGLIIPLDNNYKIPLLTNIETLPDNIPYEFLHDRVQQAAYSLIPFSEKKQVHLQIGRLLLTNVQEGELQNKIFNIVKQFNKGSELISDRLEKNQLAQLNLQAGKKAQLSSAYEVALIYLEHGINLLELDSWEHQYELTLSIYLRTLEIQLLNANFEKAENLLAIALKKTNNLLDRVKIYKIEIDSLLYQYQFESAINKAIFVLQELGVHDISTNIKPSELVIKIYEILASENKTIEDLANLPQMTDLQKIAALKIILDVISAIYATQPSLLPSVILTMFNLSLKYGNSYLSSGVYVWVGSYLCGKMGDVDSGEKFCQLSLKLLEKFYSRQLVTKVLYMIPTTVTHWKSPIQQTVEPLREAFYTGIETGDIIWGSYAAGIYSLHIFFAGENLDIIDEKYITTLSILTKFKQSFSILYIKISRKIIRELTGEIDLNNKLNNEKLDWEITIQTLLTNKDGDTLFLCYLVETIINYFCKDYASSFKSAAEFKKYENHSWGMIPIPQANFYSSLAILAYFDGSELEQKENLLSEVLSNQEKMQIWAKKCPENFQHKYDLVEAEKARVLGKNWQAAELYEQAIKGSKKHEFIHEEALAYERAAEFYLVSERKEIAQLYLKNAYHCYSRWGAKAKVKQLEVEYPEYLLGISNQNKSSQLSTTISTTGTDTEILDLATILKASQTISGEIKLERLLQNLMIIVIENAGAQTGFLILNHQDNWVIEAQGAIDTEQITTLQSIPINYVNPATSMPILPTAIINYVARTQENLVLANAIAEGQFIDDPYIVAAQSKSILCTPLLNQGKLSGIVYLENNLTTDAFTAERVKLLNILSAQAAISIDNSRLYQNLEQRVEERTKELSQTLDVLKATQKELIFENELLRGEEQLSSFDYQVGGSLGIDSPTYVVRSADRNLYKALKQGEFCHILNSRQMGKSSLMVRMIDHLSHEGYSCGAIDMTRIGSENITPEQWYKGLAVELWRSFGLIRKVKLKTWWDERKDISPVQRLSQFIEEVLLVEVAQKDDSSGNKIVVFIDEIDSVLALEFPVNDFFALIRSCYNQRTLDREYQRLTFALFGVATPSDLISDRQRTPFNIGQAVQLKGFKEHEAQPLLNGLTAGINNPQVLLKEILAWTGGQPFLTQKVCQLIRNSSHPIPQNQEAEWIEDLVQTKIITDWEAQDEPEHLKTIRDRILNSEHNPSNLLELYSQICDRGIIPTVNSLEESELLLSGLVVKEQGTLKVHNRIYQSIFDRNWIDHVANNVV